MQLYENPGWGSAIVELQLVWYGMPHDLIRAGDVYDDAAARADLGRINPLMQLPTLVLPSGEVMTESAAMTLYLADVAGDQTLVPGPLSSDRPAFLRWLIYLVSAIYPTFAFGDVPERFVPEAEAPAYQATVIAARKAMWLVMEAEAARRDGPWFLGARFSAIDLYLACMVHWRPGQDWFAAHAPTLTRIAVSAGSEPKLAATMARNFA